MNALRLRPPGAVLVLVSCSRRWLPVVGRAVVDAASVVGASDVLEATVALYKYPRHFTRRMQPLLPALPVKREIVAGRPNRRKML